MSFFGRLFSGSDTPDTRTPTDLHPSDFVALQKSGVPVIDVRTPGEFAEGHVAGARNVNVMDPDFVEAVGRLALDAEAPVYLYCRSGNRSGQAVEILRRSGYPQAINIGGFDGLVRAGAATSYD
jgi:phage shock protein E